MQLFTLLIIIHSAFDKYYYHCPSVNKPVKTTMAIILAYVNCYELHYCWGIMCILCYLLMLLLCFHKHCRQLAEFAVELEMLIVFPKERGKESGNIKQE